MNGRNDGLVDGTGQHHFHHRDSILVGHAQPVDKGRRDIQLFQHGPDLGAAAMDHNRAGPDLMQQHHILGKAGQGCGLTHGPATEFDDHAMP